MRDVGTGDPGLCAPWSFTGLPAITIPTGVDTRGLPLGVQLISGGGRVRSLLAAAAWCEGRIGFQARPEETGASA
jgi:Asp-tRNA(Asn)/Glu-tRNA(Gln) amidotransferase A subunit family amidase